VHTHPAAERLAHGSASRTAVPVASTTDGRRQNPRVSAPMQHTFGSCTSVSSCRSRRGRPQPLWRSCALSNVAVVAVGGIGLSDHAFL
jgi:hypothetical protein